MLSLPRKKMIYEKHLNPSFEAFRIDEADKKEIKYGKRRLQEFISKLIQKGFTQPHCFSKLTKKYKMKNYLYNIFINNLLDLQTSIIIENKPTLRNVNKYNYVQKDVILTFYAFFYPKETLNIFINLINHIQCPYIKSKEKFIENMKLEIMEVHKSSRVSDSVCLINDLNSKYQMIKIQAIHEYFNNSTDLNRIKNENSTCK